MVYFKINGLGYNCGQTKDNCTKEAQSCRDCIKKRLLDLGFEFDRTVEIIKIDSVDKQLKLKRETIWKKFLDVLNIKHIMLMDKRSGLTLFNYAVSGVDIDANLLSGFIQANITFSESSGVSNKNVVPSIEYQFYEFQYKKFNILLKDGAIIRVCLILDHKASIKLRNQVFQFLEDFEPQFKEELIDFREKGLYFDFQDMIDYIVEFFNIYLMFPMTLAHSIPPYELDKVKRNLVQKAIYNLAKELLAIKPFFFINNMLIRLKKIAAIKDEVILYELYQLLERKIISPTSIETIANNIESEQTADHNKMIKSSLISPMIDKKTDLEDLKEQLKTMDEDSARRLIREIMKRARAAAKDSKFHVTLNEYNRALLIAKELNLKEEITKISLKIFNLESKSKYIELDFNIEKAEHAEKNGDFINSINYYQQALKILDGFKVYNVLDPRIRKFKKKIQKLREEI
ncbi:MAG: hypothetical protein KGD68_12090 [Candidatus Lokiarchaeota archaeon]|nr:hypothetical protein [Candidatus Lokiarchaeota archaeon]